MVTAATTAERLAADLRAATADLDGYIQRRAAEMAAPLIEEARDQAAAEVAGARADAQRKDDLIAELRRRVQALERQCERWREATGVRAPEMARLADDPAPPQPLSHPPERLA